MKVFRFLINTNIFISLAAVFLTIETQVQLGMRPEWHPYLFIIFFATIFEYNLHRLITVITKKESLDDNKHKWVKGSPMLLYIIVAVSVIGFIAAILMAKKEVLLTLAPFAALTVFYSMPVFKNSRYLFRLREIPFIKIFLIAVVWSVVTIMLPVIQTGNTYETRHILLMLLERFLFVFAITIPFDIRDKYADKRAGLKTIPLAIGDAKAIALANGCLLAYFGICLFHYDGSAIDFIMPACIVSAISTCVCINSKALQRVSWYHYGILDGTMLLQGLLVMMSYYWFAA